MVISSRCLISEAAYMKMSLFSYTSVPLTLLGFVLAVAPSGMCWLRLSLKHRGHQWSDSISLGSGNSKYLPNRNCKMVNSFHFLHTFKSHNIHHMLCYRQRKGVRQKREWFETPWLCIEASELEEGGLKVNPIMCVLIHATWLHISFISVFLETSNESFKVIDCIVKQPSIS